MQYLKGQHCSDLFGSVRILNERQRREKLGKKSLLGAPKDQRLDRLQVKLGGTAKIRFDHFEFSQDISRAKSSKTVSHFHHHFRQLHLSHHYLSTSNKNHDEQSHLNEIGSILSDTETSSSLTSEATQIEVDKLTNR